jgi:hypothetical protein
MEMMGKLPSKAVIVRPGGAAEAAPAEAEQDEMVAALQAGKGKAPGSAS